MEDRVIHKRDFSARISQRAKHYQIRFDNVDFVVTQTLVQMNHAHLVQGVDFAVATFNNRIEIHLFMPVEKGDVIEAYIYGFTHAPTS